MVGARYSSSRYYFSQDHLGSTTALFNQDGNFIGRYSYSPYGEQRAATTNNSIITDNAIRYIGGYLDTDSGLYRLGARYYDPTIGRFTQADPSGQESNPYAYAGCNPINGKDPSGLLTLCVGYQIAALYYTLQTAVIGVAAAIAAFFTAGTSLLVANLVDRVSALLGAIYAGAAYFTCMFFPDAELPGIEFIRVERLI